MSTVELKDKIQKRLAEIEDESFLKEIYYLISDDEAPYQFSEEQEIRIEQARQEIKEGKVISNEEANRQAEQWLKK